MNEFRLGILVSGRGTNLQAIIDGIEKEELSATISLVISNKVDAPALERCTNHGIEVKFLDPKSFSDKDKFDNALAELLLAKKVNLICLAGYMRILGKSFIKNFKGKVINIHPSLLPAFPGLHPQKQAIDAGVKFSGCTVHFVNEEVDEGPIILQSTVPVYDSDTEDELSMRILEQEHIIYPRAIKLILENRLTISGRRVICKND
ncbi:MAG: phosphoribosylglycinamide formyltransferase [Nitrospinales bacterium]